MRTYRNVFYHDLLDRHVTVQLLREYQGVPKHEREFPALQEAVTGKAQPTNLGENFLAEMLVQAGLPRFEHQHPIELVHNQATFLGITR